MRALIIYRSASDHGRTVEDYMRDFKSRTSRDIETLDPDTKEGIAACEVYDIMQYPSVIALTDDGQLLNSWNGLPLPTISELSYYN